VATIPAIVDAAMLGAWLSTNADEQRIETIERTCAELRAGRFTVFGQQVHPDDWHHDAVDDVRYPRGVHWSRVGEQSGADIKYVWEPSRFGWAFDLARAHVLDAAAGWDSVFWELFDGWRAQNRPNTGVNWSCGQEASIRLMAVVAAASTMRDSADARQAAELQDFACVTARRVAANIGYARSQRNNHHASEAVGLLTAALLFPQNSEADAWRRTGERHLREVCDTLVFADGGTAQYSTNYHRVFVHDFVWAIGLYRTVGEMPPTWLVEASTRTTDFLAALVEPVSGRGPFYGHDDGSRLLPLSGTPHRNLAEDVATARSVLGGRPAESTPMTEGAAWFGFADAVCSPDEPATTWTRTFPDAGVHVLAAGTTRAYVRAGQYRFRPAQDDLLHCDVWVDGVNVLADSGTASYGPLRDGAGMLDGSDDHNGPRHPDRPLMRRASRFLWADWSAGGAESVAIEGVTAHGTFVADERGATIRRVVSVSEDGVEIVDTRGDDGALRAIWRTVPNLADLGWTLQIEATDSEWTQQLTSAGYGASSVTPAIAMSTRYSRRCPLRLMIERSVDATAARPNP